MAAWVHVYRADDLKLGTPVALKFLPREVERDAGMLERFHAEVRTARQVSHPHVCRVYDIGEVDGRHFLSMEYVDGEDLAVLLRRIGRLPPTKAIEIARQLCAALAAAHDKGVLHRDLKPANVMIDGFGRARVTDFGLAVAAGEASAEVAGTPAYMAPEQLAGQAATIQSDLYALGLVLYELFTGKRPFDAATVADWRRVHSQSQPPSPHLITADMDPTVERVILRCLAKEPSSRPASASQVALALPGGDPLAAAIAAGETPSPGMVAAAGGEGALAPARAWLWLGLVCLTVAGIWFMAPASTDLGLAPMENSSEVLRDRTRAIVERLGYPVRVSDDAAWLMRHYELIRWQADHMNSVEWRRRLASVGTPVLLHYRQAPDPLTPQNRDSLVTATDPIPGRPGDIYVVVDGRARLRALRVASPERLMTVDRDGPFPEAMVFELTGLDRTRFQPVQADWVPSVAFSDRREWTGTSAEVPEIPIRLSAATLNGRLVAVVTRGPWDLQKIDFVKASTTALIGRVSVAIIALAVSLTGVLVARRNLRLSRGDTAGASRVAGVTFVLVLASFLAQAHLSPDWLTAIFEQIAPAVGFAVVQALLVWALYLALEPAIRQRMPDLLVGWARLLEGRWRDPRVGRDVLIGAALGGLVAAVALRRERPPDLRAPRRADADTAVERREPDRPTRRPAIRANRRHFQGRAADGDALRPEDCGDEAMDRCHCPGAGVLAVCARCRESVARDPVCADFGRGVRGCHRVFRVVVACGVLGSVHPAVVDADRLRNLPVVLAVRLDHAGIARRADGRSVRAVARRPSAVRRAQAGNVMSNPFATEEMAAGYAAARPPVHPRVLAQVLCSARETPRRHVGRSRLRRRSLDACSGPVRHSRARSRARRVDAPPGERPCARRGVRRGRGRSVAVEAWFSRSDHCRRLSELRARRRPVFRRDAPSPAAGWLRAGLRLRCGPPLQPSRRVERLVRAFVARYPYPASEARPLDPDILATLARGFDLHRQSPFVIGLPMSRPAYEAYILTETNVAAAMRQGETLGGVGAWVHATLSQFWDDDSREVLFEGYWAELSVTKTR